MLLWQSVCTPAGVALEASHGRRTLLACRGTLGPFKSKACCSHRVNLVQKQNKSSYSPSQLSVKSRFVYANTYRAMAPGKDVSLLYDCEKVTGLQEVDWKLWLIG